MRDINQDFQSLRDIVLLEADWHASNAARLDIWAKSFGEHEFGKVLKIAAGASRARATILNGALVASEPEVRAKAS